MPWLDFVVADRHVLPEELTPYFTEKPLYLDGSFLPLNKNMADITPITRAQVGLPEDAFVMAAFGNVYKINEDLLAAWANILKQAPHAVLWLMDDNEKTTAELKRKLKQIGVAAHQVQFSPRTSYQEYLARLQVADVFLDSYPYNCGSTTHDVLNCSLPMVTLSGKTMVSRMGRSMLSALGLQELIANSFSEYVDITLKIAKDSDYQKELVKSVKSSMLRKQKNPKLLTASLENQIQSLIHKNS
jgi:predicted O-linked N-acetylglucosamine transferase (SPINDLY family)